MTDERPANRLDLRLARAALKLYPSAWQERYGAEMEAVIEQSEISTATILDLLLGAAKAYVSASVSASPLVRMRGTVAASACCWIAAVFVGAGFAKATEDVPFRSAEASHGLLGGARTGIEVLAVVTCVVIALAGAPLVVQILGQAWRGDSKALRRAFRFPALTLTIFAVATAGLAIAAHNSSGNAGTLGHLAFVAWGGLGLLAAAAVGFGTRRALAVARLHRDALVVGVTGAWVLAWVLLLLGTAVALYTAALATEAPSVAALANGPYNFSTTAVLAVIAALMMGISSLALITARRGRLAAGSLL